MYLISIETDNTYRRFVKKTPFLETLVSAIPSKGFFLFLFIK